jgi:hypothetical protein
MNSDQQLQLNEQSFELLDISRMRFFHVCQFFVVSAKMP